MRCAAISLDKKLAATGTGKSVKVWDLPSGRERWECSYPDGDGIEGLHFSADGRLLAIRDHRQSIALREAATGKDRGYVPALIVGAFCLAPDSKMIAMHPYKQGIELLSLEKPVPKGAQKGVILGALKMSEPRGYLKFITFSPDGRLVAGGEPGGRVRIWDVKLNAK